MPENKTEFDKAIERTVSQSKKYAFAKAHWMPLIIEKFKDGNNGRLGVYDFKDLNLPHVSEALERLTEGDNSNTAEDQNIVFKHFAKLTDPTLGRKAGKECKFLQWICQKWVDTPVMVEDLYKIREQLEHFEQMSGRLKQDGKPNRIDDIGSFAEMNDIMRPYEVEKQRKEAERARRRMSEEDKRRLSKESTVLYDGPEGKILVPHTIWACQYWGNQTKWCISAKNQDDNYFDIYNADGPIIICMPTVTSDLLDRYPDYASFKFALVGPEVFDELDEKDFIYPDALKDLLMAAENIRPYLKKYGSYDRIVKSQPEKQIKPLRWSEKSEENAAFAQEFRHEKLLFDNDVDIPNEYLTDEDFFVEYIDYNGMDGLFPDEFYQRHDLALRVLEENSYWAVLNFEDEVCQDPDIVRKILQKNPTSFNGLPKFLKNDPAIQMACKDAMRKEFVKHAYNGYGVQVPEFFQQDFDLAREAIAINPCNLDQFKKPVTDDTDIFLLSYARKTQNNYLSYPYTRGELSQTCEEQLKDKSRLSSALQTLIAGSDKAIQKAMENIDQEIAIKTLKNGHGLSLNLAAPELLNDLQGYVLPALKIAKENGQGDNLIVHLRNVPGLRGDSGAITSVDGAIAKIENMKKPPSAKPRRSVPYQ